MKYHIMAFVAGFILDLFLGDPYSLPHPIRWIGNYIGLLEKKLYVKSGDDIGRKNAAAGKILVLVVIATVAVIAGSVLVLSYTIHPVVGVLMETIMTYYVLATKCLKVESMKVYYSLKDGDVEGARKAVSMIVGRDTQMLDETGIAKAAIETVAENTSDGVIAPMLYTAIGGPVLGMIYKAVNTMDSMVGYKNEKYLYFGRTAAKTDDFSNYLPARISAGLMIAACLVKPKVFSIKNAFRVYKRDRLKHESPNSAHTESVCAGALGIRLAGPAVYFGNVHDKPFLGDEIRPVEFEDIKRANKLMYATAFICETICVLILIAVMQLTCL